MIYFTADSHLNHKSMLKYGPRNHPDVVAMDEALIAAWNRTVSPADTVYHLGDFTLGGQEVARGYFARLNGRIKVVPGGHDHKWAPVGDYVSRSAYRVRVLPPLYTLRIEGHIIVLCHFSLRTWYKSHYNSLHLYGHSHGRLPLWPNSMDVGVDAVGYAPISLGEVVKRLT